MAPTTATNRTTRSNSKSGPPGPVPEVLAAPPLATPGDIANGGDPGKPSDKGKVPKGLHFKSGTGNTYSMSGIPFSHKFLNDLNSGVIGIEREAGHNSGGGSTLFGLCPLLQLFWPPRSSGRRADERR
jgi:hypothetical protein